MTNRRVFLGFAVAAALATAVPASLAVAQSTGFYKKFKGQLFVSDQAFSASDDDAALAAQIKKQSKAELAATGGNEEGAEWTFHWLAVLSKKPGTPNATIFFY